MKTEQTTTFAVDDKQYAVAELPMPIRKQFEVLDAYRQRQTDLSIDLSMANTSVTVKIMELQELIRQLTAPVVVPDNAAPSNE